MTTQKQKSPENLLDEAFKSVSKGEKDTAIKLFREVLAALENKKTDGDKELEWQAATQLGIMYKSRGNLDNAEKFFKQALQAKPAHDETGINLGITLYEQKKYVEAEDILSAAKPWEKNHNLGTYSFAQVLIKTDKFLKAADMFQKILPAIENNADAQIQFGIALEKSGKTREAENLFSKVKEIFPDHFEKLFSLATRKKDQDKLEETEQLLELASRIAPEDAKVCHDIGLLFQNAGSREKAETWYKKSISITPTPNAYGQLAALHEKANDLSSAWATASFALQYFPQDPYLHLTLARCEKRAGKTDQAMERLEKIAGKSGDITLEGQIHFLLGWLYDKKDKIEEAFQTYKKAKNFAWEAKKDTAPDPEVPLRYIEQMKALDLSTLPKFGRQTRRKNEPAGLAFIIGFPRSGTTLLNQILDSHPSLTSLEEKPTLVGPALKIGKFDKGYPGALPDLKKDQVADLRELYFRDLRTYADFGPEDLIVDKLPLNLIHLPLILTLFPDAKIILALRHPMGACLSCFMHNFKMNNAMAHMFNLDNITEFYARIMDLWVFFEKNAHFDFHTVKYENVVKDLAKEAQNLCQFLGVKWSGEMLQYARHARKKGLINTPSYHQVVQPIYGDSTERWRRYESHLAPYRGKLEKFIQKFGYAT